MALSEKLRTLEGQLELSSKTLQTLDDVKARNKELSESVCALSEKQTTLV